MPVTAYAITIGSLRNMLLGAAAICVLGAAAGAEGHAGTAVQGDDLFSAAVTATKARDYAKAANLFEQLARGDDYDAQLNLALLLRAGQGRPQHFVQALEWALLAQLGGVGQAQAVSEDLAAMVPQSAQNEIMERIDAHLRQRLARGERAAVMQYVAFNRTMLGKPDMHEAYLWSLIGAALSIGEATTARDAIAAQFDADAIAKGQEEARKLFEEQDMIALFKGQD